MYLVCAYTTFPRSCQSIVQLGRAARGEQKICLLQLSRRTARDVQKWKATNCMMDLQDRRNAAFAVETTFAPEQSRLEVISSSSSSKCCRLHVESFFFRRTSASARQHVWEAVRALLPNLFGMPAAAGGRIKQI
jgi:hypothetical protein